MIAKERLDQIQRIFIWSGIGILGIAFFLPEPFNELLFYIAWFCFGIALLVGGFIAIRFKKTDIGDEDHEVEIEGKKAAAVGVLLVILALLIFILPGIGLSLKILIKII